MSIGKNAGGVQTATVSKGLSQRTVPTVRLAQNSRQWGRFEAFVPRTVALSPCPHLIWVCWIQAIIILMVTVPNEHFCYSKLKGINCICHPI